MFLEGVRTGWIAALLALAIAVFAFAPAVEAATCGFEPAAAHSISAVDQNADDDAGGAGKSHTACNHGHCHHGSSLAKDMDGSSVAISVSGASPLWPADNALLSRVSDGPERPPRA